MNSWATTSLPPLDKKFRVPQLSLKNTATSTIDIVPRQSVYRMYVCGITPYDATHLGHANTYLAFDVINRFLRATGAKVVYVQNITDIDDPLLERANRDGVDWRELASSQIDLFRGDMVDLHILPPDHYIGAVEAIPLVVEAIEMLTQANATYLVQGDTYFSVHADSNFGKRSHLGVEESIRIFSERGGDPQRVGKHDPLDALLWLKQRPNEPGWESPLGVGRPGWHIECCAIALHYLEPEVNSQYSIDIQGGGSDLIFPHHEMSAAQSSVMNKKEFARLYVHAGMIGLHGEKMSKSKGNLVFVSTLINEGHDPMAIRLALLSHHYQDDHIWSEDDLTTATRTLSDLRIALSREEVPETDNVINEILAALSQNLDTPSAIAALNSWVVETLTTDSAKIQTPGHAGELSRAIDALLGIAI
jgi:L-cysteine:1D-myo-inositol 2-amino-2-deoxy-alpha-D-glucopyranoside ligase